MQIAGITLVHKHANDLLNAMPTPSMCHDVLVTTMIYSNFRGFLVPFVEGNTKLRIQRLLVEIFEKIIVILAHCKLFRRGQYFSRA